MLRYTLILGVTVLMALTGPVAQAAEAPASQPAWTNLNFDVARTIPVQYSNGRTMPLDTLAREVIWQITGKGSWQGYDPVGLLLAWTWEGKQWINQPVVLVGFPELQKQLGLAEDRKQFSYSALAGNAKLRQMFSTDEESEDVSAAQRSAQQIASRLGMFQGVMAGQLLRIVPPPQDPGGTWGTPAEPGKDLGQAERGKIDAAVQKMRSGFAAGDAAGFEAGTKELAGVLAALNAPASPDPSIISMEVRYNQWRPFLWGWVLTCLAMVVGLVELGLPSKALRAAAWVLLVAGFAALTAGIAMRWAFSGHAPLATMYESLVFMGWGVTAIGIVTVAIVRLRAALPIVAGVATAILIVADTTPLDAMAAPLVPVLRNTMWLTFHVLTVMLAYSALALAMGVGHVQATMLAYRPTQKERTNQIGKLLYGMIMVGCAFLTAGIIFGAIWANKSWGRYWGWDPKETWSLITLLGYMVMLHGRRIGWFGSFGLAAWSVLCFQLVIMTYYGVNFVLGRGLHSYGFSSGGQVWVGLYEAVETAFLLWMWGAYSRATEPAIPAVTKQSTASR